MNDSMKTGGLLVLLCAWILSAPAPHAGGADKADVPRISIEELKKMMDAGAPVVILDVQPREIYDAGHIQGAISLPWKAQIALEDVWSLPEDRLIVLYCDCGPGESDSADVAAQLIRLGYENVKVLKDPSIKGWKELGYPTAKE